MCRSAPINTSVATFNPTLATTVAATNIPFRVITEIFLNNGHKVNAFIDGGSTDKSFISERLVDSLKLKKFPDSDSVGMATTSLTTNIIGYCLAELKLQQRTYSNVKLSILKDLCTDVILGTDFQALHDSVIISYGGKELAITFCALTSVVTEPPTLFPNLTKDCKPIATKSRKHSNLDKQFITKEIQFLLKNGIIEPSSSPWWAQVLVVNEPKKRRVIDYSQTVNRYTLLMHIHHLVLMKW